MKRVLLFLLLSAYVAISMHGCTEKVEKIVSLSQLDGKRICVLSGSSGDLAARRNFPNSEFMVHANAADAALAVKTGKADALVFNKSVLENITDRNPDLMVLDERVSELEVAAAVKKGNADVLSDINSAINEFSKNGTLEELRNKWISSKYTEAPKIYVENNSGGEGTLKMGTNAAAEPFSFYSNGVITGLDIELAMLISKSTGKKIEITDMTFEGLIPALQAGKIDFALANFNVTEERKKVIDYSTPYIVNDISVLVRK